MEYPMIVLLVVTVLIGLSQQQIEGLDRCLFSRQDFMPCLYQNRRLLRARENEYTIHYTNLRQSPSGGIECNVRRGKDETEQMRRSITTVGTEDLKILFSPGFIFNTRNIAEESIRYDDQLLVDYRVKCKEGDLAYFIVTTLDLEGPDTCRDPMGNPKCQDYLLIHRGIAGTTELCGNITTINSVLPLESGEFNVTFRTSEERKFTGFQMYVICFRPEETNISGCLRPEDFAQPVCNASSGNERGNTRFKRQEYDEGITYSDIFQNYPPGIKVKKDVANFHKQWLRQKRQAMEDSRFIERIVLFNESVIYTKDTIRIADSDGIETARFEDVLTLQTFDANGDITTYFRGVNSDIYPHFFGPGPLIIIGRYAYFQLFIIDPRGLIPNPEEEEDLEELNRPLLASVDTTMDIILNDPNPIREPFEFLFGDSGRKKREVIDDTPSGPHREKRQEPTDPSPIEFSEEAVFLVLMNLEACNPVLRSQARSSLAFYESNETTADRLNELRNFTINCISDMPTLECSVNEGFAPALDSLETTYCTFNNTEDQTIVRKQCNPFYGGVDLTDVNGDSVMGSVTVEAINCNGQRVMHVHSIM